MKSSYFYILPMFLMLCASVKTRAQVARVLRTDLSIRPFYKFENTDLQPRFVYDPSDKSFYTISWDGGVHHLIKNADGTFQHVRIASASDHAINYLQGLALKDGTLYLVGNVVVSQGVKGYGKAVKAKINAGSPLKWVEVFKTVEHASSKTLFDHSFSAICFSPDGRDMYISSGSRTDHGEIKNNDGLYPNLREIALTSCIFKISAATENLVLLNDSASLAPYVHVRGVRNAFSLAFNRSGDLFSVENSGERNDPEEMNWIRAGSHYGFPWEMGNNDTPMQFAGYKPEQDKLLNHNYTGYIIGSFHDDKTYPQKPKNLTYRKPIQNLGPDADKYTDPVTGNTLDASDAGGSIGSFTAHRSPLGLVFDNTDSLGGEYRGKGFVLSYQAGTDSYGPMQDTSQDLLMLNLKKNAAGDDYVMNAYKIAADFNEPTDARIVGNKLYVLEARGQIWEITFPKEITTGVNEPTFSMFRAYPNPIRENLTVEWEGNRQPVSLSVLDVAGRSLLQVTRRTEETRADLDLSSLKSGIYFLKTESGSHNQVTKILVNP